MAMARMGEGWKQALRINHQELRSGLILKNILPAFRTHLTDSEFSQVADLQINVAQVDELVKILLTKENRHFDEFCRVCERNGYPQWAKRLRASAGGRKETEAFDDKDLMAEKSCSYYIDIVEVDDAFYGDLLKSIDAFVLESSNAQFLSFRREAERVIRHSQHVTGSKVRLSHDRMDFLRDIQVLWANSLEYRSLREVIMRCEDEGLMKQLQEYEDLLRAKGETIIYHCKKQKQMNTGLYMKLKAKHETTLATLMRMQDFLVNEVGLDDAIFTGFREGCIELYFKLSPETASVSMDPLRSSASRLTLLSLGVSKVELSGHWVIDTNSGGVTYLKTFQNYCFTEDTDSDMSADEEQQHEGSLSEETTQECPSVKRVPLWDWELCPPSKRAKLYSKEDFPSAVPSDAMQCRPVENPHDCLAQDRDSDVSASEEGVCSGSFDSDGATSEKSPDVLLAMQLRVSDVLEEVDTSVLDEEREMASLASPIERLIPTLPMPMCVSLQRRHAEVLEEQWKLKMREMARIAEEMERLVYTGLLDEVYTGLLDEEQEQTRITEEMKEKWLRLILPLFSFKEEEQKRLEEERLLYWAMQRRHAEEEQRKLKLQLHAAQSTGSAVGSAARRRRRRKSPPSGIMLFGRTLQPFSEEESTDEAMAYMDLPSSIQEENGLLHGATSNFSTRSEVADSSAASVTCNPYKGDEQLQCNDLEPDFNLLEEPLAISGNHVSPDQVERVNHEDELLSLEREEDEAPSKVCIQHLDAARFNNFQRDSDSQSDSESP